MNYLVVNKTNPMNFTSKDLFKLSILPFLTYMFDNIFQAFAEDFYISHSIDTLSHFLGGVSIAYGASYALSLIQKRGWLVIKKDILRTCIITASVTVFAVVWEFYEFTSDYLSGTAMQPSSADTIKDLAMGMIGALVFCVVTMPKNEKKGPHTGGRR